MIRKHNSSQRLIACVLLMGLVLQGCNNPSNQFTSQDKHKNVPKATNQIKIIKQLINQKLTSVGWETTDLYKEQDTLKVQAIERHGAFTSNPHELSVSIAPTIDLEQLSHLNPEEQKRVVHFISPQNDQPGRVIISKGGLLGGMMEGDATQDTKTSVGKEEAHKQEAEEKRKAKKARRRANQKARRKQSAAIAPLKDLNAEGKEKSQKPAHSSIDEKPVDLTVNGNDLPIAFEFGNDYEQYFNQGIACVERGEYENGKIWFLKCDKVPGAFHNLGWLCEEGHIDTKDGVPDYEQAAAYYKNGTLDSFGNLGRLYKNGLVGKIDGIPDYQTAIKYLELSGNPASLCDLGIIFKEGYVGNGPNYQKAKEYLERSNTGIAHMHLGEMYLAGDLGSNIPEPDYEQAKRHFEISASKSFGNAFTKLGYLHLNGYVGKIGNDPDYKLASYYLNNAILSPNIAPDFEAAAYHNLGVMHVRGRVGSNQRNPDYQKAKAFFEQSGMSISLYNIGNLYEWELGQGPSQTFDYQTAFKYYERSGTAQAKLSILGLYQLKLIGAGLPKEERQELIKQTIEEINRLLPTLSDSECYWIKGVAEYYIGNLESAVISLQQALWFGSEEPEIPKLITEIEEKLERESQIPTLEKEPTTNDLLVEKTKAEEQVIPGISHTDTVERPTETKRYQKEEVQPEAVFPEEITKDTKSIKFVRLTKEQKKSRQTERKRLAFLAACNDTPKAARLADKQNEFLFLDKKLQKQVLTSKKSNKKLQEIWEWLTNNNPWELKGPGKPEKLKHAFKDHKGCYSRRLDGEGRLIYKMEKGKILIIDLEGHYTNQKK